MFHVPNINRIRQHPILATDDSAGNNGAFLIPQLNGRDLWVIASDGSDWELSNLPLPKWEHVSVHIFDGKKMSTPRWDDMCKVKDIFWDEEDVVIQFHPKKSEYINNHRYTLHLWRVIDYNFPTPPKLTVGI